MTVLHEVECLVVHTVEVVLFKPLDQLAGVLEALDGLEHLYALSQLLGGGLGIGEDGHGGIVGQSVGPDGVHAHDLTGILVVLDDLHDAGGLAVFLRGDVPPLGADLVGDITVSGSGGGLDTLAVLLSRILVGVQGAELLGQGQVVTPTRYGGELVGGGGVPGVQLALGEGCFLINSHPRHLPPGSRSAPSCRTAPGWRYGPARPRCGRRR